MVPPASLRVSRVRRYSGYCRPTWHFVYGTLTLFGLPSQVILLYLVVPYSVLNPGCIATSGLPSFLFARRYSENLFWFLFLALLRCFSSGGFPAYTYLFTIRWPASTPAGFPHSEICGSMAICAYPQLITSFVGSWCQGILHALFLTWPLCFKSFLLSFSMNYMSKCYLLPFRNCRNTFVLPVLSSL